MQSRPVMRWELTGFFSLSSLQTSACLPESCYCSFCRNTKYHLIKFSEYDDSFKVHKFAALWSVWSSERWSHGWHQSHPGLNDAPQYIPGKNSWSWGRCSGKDQKKIFWLPVRLFEIVHKTSFPSSCQTGFLHFDWEEGKAKYKFKDSKNKRSKNEHFATIDFSNKRDLYQFLANEPVRFMFKLKNLNWIFWGWNKNILLEKY